MPGKDRQPFLAVLLLLVGEVEDGVDQVAALAADRVGEHPQPDADLRRREPCPLGVVERLGQVLDQRAELLVEVGDGLGGGAQDRVAEQPDVADCHAIEGIRRIRRTTQHRNLFDR